MLTCESFEEDVIFLSLSLNNKKKEEKCHLIDRKNYREPKILHRWLIPDRSFIFLRFFFSNEVFYIHLKRQFLRHTLIFYFENVVRNTIAQHFEKHLEFRNFHPSRHLQDVTFHNFLSPVDLSRDYIVPNSPTPVPSSIHTSTSDRWPTAVPYLFSLQYA